MTPRLKKTCLALWVLMLCSGLPAISPHAEQAVHREVIMMFNQEVSWEEIEGHTRELEEAGVSVIMDLPLINAVAIKVPASVSLEDLADDPRVLKIEMDQETTNLKDDMGAQKTGFIKKVTSKSCRRFYPWNILKLYDHPYDSLLNWIDEDLISENVAEALSSIESTTLRIAVFDTGIKSRHEIRRLIKSGIDIINARTDAKGKRSGKIKQNNDDNGHGTHVAGTICAALDKKFGWGRHAKFAIHPVKILDQDARGKLSNVVMGLQWAIDNDMDIVNMSIGYRKDSPAVRLAVQEAHKAGLVMVAAAGNKSNYNDSIVLEGLGEGGAGEGGAGEGSPGEGDLPLYSTMYPAKYPEVIAVSASTMEGKPASFSIHDSHTDMMAPGTCIVSLDITSGEARALGSASGTSMAVPLVTAAAAMMLAVDSDLSPGEIKNLLVETSDRGDHDPLGVINLAGALSMVEGRKMETLASDIPRPKKSHERKKYRKKLKQRLKKVKIRLWD